MFSLFKPFSPLAASALLLFSPPTQGATWFQLQEPGSSSGVTVEVDLDSLRSRGERRELVTRITYAQPRRKQDISFQSVVAGLEIFCDNGLMVWKTASFFLDGKAEGNPLSAENFGMAGLPSGLLDLLPDRISATLLRSACGRPATTSP